MFLQLLSVADTWQKKVSTAVTNILIPLLVIACSIGVIWAVVLGIKMMKADNKEQREENKAKLINIAISIVAVAVLISLFYAIIAWIGDDPTKLKDEFDIISNVGNPLNNTLSLVKQCASMVIFRC